jgi:hypothetical protein
MAGPRVNKKKEAAAAAAAASEPKPEGPVLTAISKRLRAFRKKLNEITDLEEKQREGKELIDQQLEKLRNKTTVNVTIDELEKVFAVLGDAVKEEVALARQQALEEAAVETKKEAERAEAAEAAIAEAQAAAKAAQEGEAAAKEEAEAAKKAAKEAAAAKKPADVEKVVQLLYFTWVSSWRLFEHSCCAVPACGPTVQRVCQQLAQMHSATPCQPFNAWPSTSMQRCMPLPVFPCTGRAAPHTPVWALLHASTTWQASG